MNLYKWPESDAEFVRSVSRNGSRIEAGTRVVDSISCRQMYLRSYTFSRKETVPEKTKKCFGRVREKVSSHGVTGRRSKEKVMMGKGKRKCLVLRKVKEVSCSALIRFFHRLLSCAASVDVVDQKDVGFC